MAEKAKRNKIKVGSLVTPIGVARYPHVITPDTKFKAEGEYRCPLIYSEEVADALRPKLQALLDKGFEELKKEHFGDANSPKAKRLKKNDVPLKAVEDEEGNETGDYLLTPKRTASGKKKDGSPWKAKINIVDSKGKKLLASGLSIWGGSKLRCDCDVFAWYSPKDNEVGLKLEIVGVQIVELVSGGGERESAFGSVEGGYEAPDESDDRASGFSDSDDDASDDDEDGSADF